MEYPEDMPRFLVHALEDIFASAPIATGPVYPSGPIWGNHTMASGTVTSGLAKLGSEERRREPLADVSDTAKNIAARTKRTHEGVLEKPTVGMEKPTESMETSTV
jgi:hypothetical protein